MQRGRLHPAAQVPSATSKIHTAANHAAGKAPPQTIRTATAPSDAAKKIPSSDPALSRRLPCTPPFKTDHAAKIRRWLKDGFRRTLTYVQLLWAFLVLQTQGRTTREFPV